MSLNAGVLDDLENGGITPPVGTQAPTGAVTITPATDQIPVATELSEAQLKDLPTKDITFNLVNEGVSKVVSLKEVENDIIGQESIDKTGYERVSVAFESVANGPVTISEFTSTPSKVNFDYVKRKMKSTIATEEASLVTNFTVFIDQPLTEACNRILVYKDMYRTYIDLSLRELRAVSIDMLEQMRTKPSTIVQYGREFLNILDFDIGGIDTSMLETDSVDIKTIDGYVKGIQSVMSKMSFKAYVHATIEGEDTLSKDNISKYAANAFTAIDLVKFFSKDVEADMDRLLTKAETSVLELMKVQEASKQAIGDNEVTTKFISDNMVACVAAYEDIERLAHTSHSLIMLSTCGKKYLDFIKSMN